MTDQPMNPCDYVPSSQVRLVMQMSVEARHAWRGGGSNPFDVGTRHGLNQVFRALVELETKITDPDDLDGLCSDLITEYKIDQA